MGVTAIIPAIVVVIVMTTRWVCVCLLWVVATAAFRPRAPSFRKSTCAAATGAINDVDGGPVCLYNNILLPPQGTHNEQPPLVILHGLLGAARNFQSWAKLYQQHEAASSTSSSTARAVVCLDLRNHGRTAVGHGARSMDYRAMALDVQHTLQVLGVRRAHVVGHSMGGKVAAALALLPQYPYYGGAVRVHFGRTSN